MNTYPAVQRSKAERYNSRTQKIVSALFVTFLGVTVYSATHPSQKETPIAPPNEESCESIVTTPNSAFVAADIAIKATTAQELTQDEAIAQGEQYVLQNGCGFSGSGDVAVTPVTCIATDKAPQKAEEYDLACIAPAYHP